MNNGSLRRNHIFIQHKLAAAGHSVADILNPEHFNFSCGSGSTLTSRTFSHFSTLSLLSQGTINGS